MAMHALGKGNRLLPAPQESLYICMYNSYMRVYKHIYICPIFPILLQYHIPHVHVRITYWRLLVPIF